MEKLTTNLINKFDSLKEKINKIQLNYKGNLKNNLLFYDDIINKLDLIEEIIDNFEIENKGNFYMNEEFEKRINENIKINKIIKDISPLILLYQLNN